MHAHNIQMYTATLCMLSMDSISYHASELLSEKRRSLCATHKVLRCPHRYIYIIYATSFIHHIQGQHEPGAYSSLGLIESMEIIMQMCHWITNISVNTPLKANMTHIIGWKRYPCVSHSAWLPDFPPALMIKRSHMWLVVSVEECCLS